MKTSIKIGSKTITNSSDTYVIAEIGVNHEGSLSKAKELIRLAKLGGADCAKFQSYKASKLAAKESPSYWDTSKEPTTSQYELFSKLDSFGKNEFQILKSYCEEIDIEFLSTPFDDASLDYLDKLVNFYKIASADITNTPFLRKVAAKGKPVILSSGASTLDEIKNSIKTLKDSGCKEISVLHCILNYPTDDENANLLMIKHLKKEFPELIIGYSDHTLPDEHMTTLVTAELYGAKIIEKHFTDDKSLVGNDHYHAMDHVDLANFRKISKKINNITGTSSKKNYLPSEEISRKNARRSIVTSGPIKENETLSENNLTYKRPGTGISPTEWDKVIGSISKKNLPDDHILQWEDIKK